MSSLGGDGVGGVGDEGAERVDYVAGEERALAAAKARERDEWHRAHEQPAGGGADASSQPATQHGLLSSGGAVRSAFPEPSASKVVFHTGDDIGVEIGDGDADAEQQRLSPRRDTIDTSSKEASTHGAAGDAAAANGADGSASSPERVAELGRAGSPPVAMGGEPVVIALLNFHSGGKTGAKASVLLQELLGADRVFDLVGSRGPTAALRKFKGTPNLRVVIGGGDGTINWVLSQMRVEGMENVPSACIPLGTGNDSSRAFGWGFKYPGSKGIKRNLSRVQTAGRAQLAQYDRWHALVQYDDIPTQEFADSLPASLRLLRTEADIPEFYRHPSATSLPLLPPPKLVRKLQKHNQKHDLPGIVPAAAVRIDRDAYESGYNVRAAPLLDRLLDSPPLATRALQPAAPREEQKDVELVGASPAPVSPEPLVVSPHSDSGTTASPDWGRGGEAAMGCVFGGEFNNYFSFGIDAQIQERFHYYRENHRGCFCGRLCNMAAMGVFGAKNFFCCEGKSLDCTVEVRDDAGLWVQLPLPPGLRSLVLLNTPTYAGGRSLWGVDKRGKTSQPRAWECVSQRQSLDDGLFEIVGLSSTWHLGTMMIGLARGIRLAQVNECRITFRSPLMAQVDGEPFLSKPATWHIRPLRPATMLTLPEKMVRT